MITQPNRCAVAPEPARARLIRLIAVATTLAAGLTATAQAGLNEEVENAIRGAKLLGATVSVSVRDCDSGEQLVSQDDAVSMIPASNLKLYTTGAALHVLGPEFEFQTRMQLHDDDLIIVGDGDPAFADPVLLDLMAVPDGIGMDFDTFLAHWIDPVVATGRTSIDKIIVDDRIFDRAFVHPTWPVGQLNRAYCAEVSGFNFHLNIIQLHLEPTDGLPRMTPVPRLPSVEIQNKATSNRGVHDKSTAWVARTHATNRMTLYGNVKFASGKPIEVTFHNPADTFAHMFADRIRRAGIAVGTARVADEDELFEQPRSLGPVVRTPIGTVLTRCNRDSENLYAESLLKRAGYAVTRHSGSWINGAAIVRQVAYERLEQPSSVKDMIIDDGSGLSRNNRITAAATTDWLNSFHRDRTLGPIFINSLATAGETGTLRKRFSRTDLSSVSVQAKTGYINGVSCLSGYVTADDGRRRSFSVLVNELNAPGQVRLAKRLQERVVGLIASELRRMDVTLGG